MLFQFLGTSSGTPTKTRNVSALALRSPDSGDWCLVDCGEGTQHQILHTGFSLRTLRAIFITHIHGDHCYGLPGLLASAGMLNRTEPLFIAGPPAVEQFTRCVMATTQLWLPYRLEFVGVDEVAGRELLPGLAVRATALSHRVPSFAYSFMERQVENRLDTARLNDAGIAPGPLWGQLQQGKDVVSQGRVLRAADYLLPPRKRRKIIVGGDNDTPALLAGEARDADVLIHEATYTAEGLEKMGPEPQHSSARMVAQFAQQQQLANLVLTHFSPRYQQGKSGASLVELEAEARAHYRGNLFLANDLDQYELDRQGCLSHVPAAAR